MYMSEYNALCIDRNHAISQDDYGISDCHFILVLLDYMIGRKDGESVSKRAMVIDVPLREGKENRN